MMQIMLRRGYLVTSCMTRVAVFLPLHLLLLFLTTDSFHLDEEL